MKIVDNADTSVEFSAIKVGDCFYYDRCLFIKINPVNELGHDRVANAFCFADNNITYVPSDWNVTPVTADIVIRRKGVQE
jgi:hypothetical protein